MVIAVFTCDQCGKTDQMPVNEKWGTVSWPKGWTREWLNSDVAKSFCGNKCRGEYIIENANDR